MSDYISSEPFIPEISNIKNIKIAIVQADFNRNHSDRLLESCLEELETSGILLKNIQKFLVPGSLEIPAIMKKLQQSGEFSGIIGMGIVIKGGTNHYEIVTEETSRGIMQCSLSSPVPVINAVLGGNTKTQIEERLHKGKSFAQGLLRMIQLHQQIETISL